MDLDWPTLIKRHKKSPKHRMNMYSKLKSKTPPATIDSNTSDGKYLINKISIFLLKLINSIN